MRSVTSMCSPAAVGLFFVLGGFWALPAAAQVNSPYSRFGVGDLYNSRNVVSKGMGGLATPYAELQSINFINPASYSHIGFVTFDVGIETELRTIRNRAQTESFESANMIFNYATLGVPLLKNKQKTKTLWGLAFGLRPVSRVRYNIQTFQDLPGIDSAITEFRGNGGVYRGFVGTGFKLGNLSLGANIGYQFGQQDLNTFRSLQSDSIFYYVANINNKTSFNQFWVDLGAQYELKLGKKSMLRLGANGNLGGKAKAERDLVQQTSFYNSDGSADSIDVVERSKTFGTYTFPSSFSVGAMLDLGGKLSIGGEYEQTRWTDFRNFNRADNLADVNMLRIGTQWIPDPATGKQYFKQVAYRAGYFTGKDYVMAGNQQLPVWGVTLGLGLPVKRYNAYSTQFTTINTSFEFGKRGNNQSPYSETYFRINVGLALSDIWFIKRQYD